MRVYSAPFVSMGFAPRRVWLGSQPENPILLVSTQKTMGKERRWGVPLSGVGLEAPCPLQRHPQSGSISCFDASWGCPWEGATVPFQPCLELGVRVEMGSCGGSQPGREVQLPSSRRTRKGEVEGAPLERAGKLSTTWLPLLRGSI